MSRERRRRRQSHGGTTSGVSPEWHEREKERIPPSCRSAHSDSTTCVSCCVAPKQQAGRPALSLLKSACATDDWSYAVHVFSSGAPCPGIGAAGFIIQASCGSPRTHMQASRPGGFTLSLTGLPVWRDSSQVRPFGGSTLSRQRGPESSCKGHPDTAQ